MRLTELELKSVDYRRAILRMIYHAKAGHTGGSLSCIDILINQPCKCDRRSSTGSMILNWVPQGSFGCTEIVPPMDSTSVLQMPSPIP